MHQGDRDQLQLLGIFHIIYGALAGLIFFYLWLYYTSLVFIIGAEVGWAFDRAKRPRRRG